MDSQTRIKHKPRQRHKTSFIQEHSRTLKQEQTQQRPIIHIHRTIIYQQTISLQQSKI